MTSNGETAETATAAPIEEGDYTQAIDEACITAVESKETATTEEELLADTVESTEASEDAESSSNAGGPEALEEEVVVEVVATAPNNTTTSHWMIRGAAVASPSNAVRKLLVLTGVDGAVKGTRRAVERTRDAYHAAGRFVMEKVSLGKRKSPDAENSDSNNNNDDDNNNVDDETLESPTKRARLADDADLSPTKSAEEETTPAAMVVTPAKSEAEADDNDNSTTTPAAPTLPAAVLPEPPKPVVIESPFEFVAFDPSGGKKPLPHGPLFEAVGGRLLDRDENLETLYKTLAGLATAQRGDSDSADEPKKDHKVPLIEISGPSGIGKTEFLRWISNNCCTFAENNNGNPLLGKINEVAGQEEQPPLDNLLVLYASFSGTSAYASEEGKICGTTIERLLRSFYGSLEFTEKDRAPPARVEATAAPPTTTTAPTKPNKPRRFRGFDHGGDSILEVFGNNKEGRTSTGVVFLLDDLQCVEQENPEEFHTLMESILGFSQKCSDKGTFCTVVGTTTKAHDAVCGHPVVPIQFSTSMPTMEATARKLLRRSSSSNADDDSDDDDNNSEDSGQSILDEGLAGLSLSVTMKVLQSSYRVKAWEDFVCGLVTQTVTATDVLGNVPLAQLYRMPPGVAPKDVFELAARTVLGRKIPTEDRATAEAVVNHLSGCESIETDATSGHSKGTSTLSLPGWRIFQFLTGYGGQVFPQIRNWVLVEAKKLFYEYGPAESTKTLETATMALLELRRAMLLATTTDEEPPTLGEIYEGLGVHHNLARLVLQVRASADPTDIRCFCALPHAFEIVRKPTLFVSNCPGEKGVEGILRKAYRTREGDDLAVFFQTKLYTPVGPDETADWLASAHKRARQLGYERGEYIVQLFVPGTIDDDLEGDDNSTIRSGEVTKDWPKDSMVFSDTAMMDVFEPFVSLKSVLED